MKKMAFALLAVMVLMVLFSVLSAKVVLLILVGATIIALFGLMFSIGLKSWIELARKDPEKAHKLWCDMMCDWKMNQGVSGF